MNPVTSKVNLVEVQISKTKAQKRIDALNYSRNFNEHWIGYETREKVTNSVIEKLWF